MKQLDPHVGFDENHDAIQVTPFPYDDIDEALGFIHQSPPTARQEAAELFRQLATWCFRGNKPLRVATAKFAAIAGGLRPDLLGDRTLEEIAIELGCTKQNLSHQSSKFTEAFGIRFARCRSKEARAHMARARIGGPNRNIQHQQKENHALTDTIQPA
jgi:hypothetical protein